MLCFLDQLAGGYFSYVKGSPTSHLQSCRGEKGTGGIGDVKALGVLWKHRSRGKTNPLPQLEAGAEARFHTGKIQRKEELKIHILKLFLCIPFSLKVTLLL